MFQSLAGPLLRWWVLSFLLHLAVIGCLLLSSRLPSETAGAVQVVLISLPGDRAGTGPTGGGGGGGGHSAPEQVSSAPGSTGQKSHQRVGQKAQITAETPMKPDEVPARPLVAKLPSRKLGKETAHPNTTQKRAYQTKHESSTASPLASAAPSPIPSRPAPVEDLQDGSVRPEGERVDGTDGKMFASADEGEREGSSASVRSGSSHNILGLGGGPRWGRGGGYGSGIGTGTGPGAGLGSGGGTDWRLLILERIHRAKRYPPLARQWGMEGTAEVRFRIAGDGSVEDVALVRSSGFPILDRASVETIKRAAPLPVVPGTIHVPISYRLRKGP